MIVSPSGASSGIGFAIPSNLVHAVTSAAASGTAPRRPWLGTELQSLTPELAASLKIDTPSGVLVASVVADGPGSVAGLKTGDIIVSIDGDDIDDLGALNYRLATRTIGSDAKLGVVREGRQYGALVRLEAAPEIPPRDKRLIGGSSALAGMTVLNLSPAVAEELSYPDTAKGVIVSDVASGSNAAGAGFQRGDVIASINDEAIKTTARLADLLSTPVPYIDLAVKRGSQMIRRRMPG
jgi:S1-C subfamily serine protease